MYNFRCRTRIAGGFMIRDYVANQSKDNNKQEPTSIKLEAGSFIYNAKKRYPNFLEYRFYFIL